ncbi:hypothetical protein MHBO_002393 [Bonamia ostreae]|uniref:Uncharacterized protein n=1 Tax=Bonamia ostreae TaxID=126728 RepID=A0ABV2AM69_9EUKA
MDDIFSRRYFKFEDIESVGFEAVFSDQEIEEDYFENWKMKKIDNGNPFRC